VADGVTVGSLLGARGEDAGLNLDLLAGAAGLDRRVTRPHVRTAGLALTGIDDGLGAGHIVVFGENEVQYLERAAAPARLDVLRDLLARDVPCVLLTNGADGPVELADAAERAGVPLVRTALPTSAAVSRLTTMLEDRLAPRETRHGVLIDILGLGVLLTGESGIGKSECALDLIVRGHRLVADDTVEIRCRGQNVLIGTSPELSRNHVEIRGLGLVNVTDLFGIAATRSSKRVELVVALERWEPGREYERLGLDSASTDILGVPVPYVKMPVAPGRNLAMLVEVAARHQLLRSRGRHAARMLAERLERRLEQLADRDADDTEAETL
jgi:HPr kinase/phosphorylase